MTSPSVNPITTQFLNGTSLFGTGGSMSGSMGMSNILQQIESMLASMMGGGFPGMNGGNSSSMPWQGNQWPVQNTGGYPGQQAGGFNAQGLRNLKLTTKSGPPLNLQEDMQGNLYNMQGKSVGMINQQTGEITLNSSAKQEIAQLRFGSGDFFGWGHKPDASGNVSFGSEVAVNPGDLTQTQTQQSGQVPAIPVSSGPSFYPLQMETAVQPAVQPLGTGTRSNYDLAA